MEKTLVKLLEEEYLPNYKKQASRNLEESCNNNITKMYTDAIANVCVGLEMFLM